MTTSPILPDEVERLACLESYGIIDTAVEADFEDLAILAGQVCGTPAALITLVDKDRQWFKSHIGTELTGMPRAISFCGHTIAGKGILEVENTTRDPRFADNPLVVNDPRVRFYAGAPLRTPEGFAIGTICVLDLVPRKLNKDQLRALESLSRQVVSQMRLRRDGRALSVSELFQRSTIDAIDACVCTLDETGRVLSINQAWRDFESGAGFLGGLTAGQKYLESADVVIQPATPVDVAIGAGLESVLAGKVEAFGQEFRFDHQNEQRWLLVRASRFEAGGKPRLVVVHEDVTDRRRAVAFAIERRGLTEAVRSMEQVLGVVGHELRTPLAGLRAMTDYVLDPAARATQDFEPFLRSIGDEVIRMSDTVDTLLEAARLNSGRASWNWSAFDLATVTRQVVAQFSALKFQENVRLEADIDPAIGPIRGDAGAVHRLISNLVGNARKHTCRGRVRITARPREVDASPGFELSVTDTGDGIAPEILGRLGQAFALNSGVVGNHFVSGTGLGLAICKGIAGAHGGRILIDSAPGTGTCVTVLMRSDLEQPAAGTSENLFTGSASRFAEAA